MRNLILTSFLAIMGFVVSAQKGGYTLKFKVNGCKDTTVFLANYYGNKLYYADTTKCNAKGEFQFSTKKKFEPGLYAVVVSGKYFEIVLNNENVYIETEKADLVNKVVVKESKENKLFYEYIYFINAKRMLADPIRNSAKDLKKDDPKLKKAKEDLAALDKEVKAFQQKFITDNPTSLTAKFIKLSLDIEIPEQPKKPDGSPVDSAWTYKYAHTHYFDNLDFSDDRMVRSPFFHNKVDKYFKDMILQIPDTVIAEINRLFPKFEQSKEQFKYVCHKLTYDSETSKIMCFDKVFVYLVEKYYNNGKATWLKDDKLKKVQERAAEISPCTCGKLATPITLPDSSMAWKKLYDVKSDYTILVFWDPECGHCKTELPKFAELMKKYKGSNKVSVYSVSQDHSAAWKKFIKTNHMEDFVNVAVPKEIYEGDGQKAAHELVQKGLTDYNSLNYRNFYDIISTPRIFLLDKDKKIVAKQLEADQMDKIIEHFLKQGKKW
ncbi:MAG TPA: redoxin domain-containing protein [Flavobacteriales bacterium]|nr:redoxin domain-containing protein [Flavobacteriales bacterium]